MNSRLFATPINTARLMLILAVLLAALPGSAQQPENIPMISLPEVNDALERCPHVY